MHLDKAFVMELSRRECSEVTPPRTLTNIHTHTYTHADTGPKGAGYQVCEPRNLAASALGPLHN